MGDDQKYKYIKTKQIAKMFNKSISHCARRARESVAKGNEWPKKSGSWYAPIEVWASILQKNRGGTPPIKNDIEELYSANKAAKKMKELYPDDEDLKKSAIWLSVLGERSIQKGRKWPIQSGRAKLAPLSEWIKIAKDKELVSWKTKKDN